MLKVAEGAGHMSRCLRVGAIDWSASAEKASLFKPVEIGPDVLDVDRLKKHYRVAASAIFGGREARAVKAVEDISFSAQGSRSSGDRRRIGLRQVDARQGPARARDGDRGPRRVRSRRDPEPADRTAPDKDDLRHPDDLPESVRHAEPELFGRVPDHSHAGAVPHRRQRRRAARDHARPSRSGEAAARLRAPQPAAIVGRAEAAHRRRPRLRRAPARDHRRRADVGARRLGSGGDQRSPDESPARIEDDHGLHQPRSLGGALSRRPDRS